MRPVEHDSVTLVTEDDEDMAEADGWELPYSLADLTSDVEGAAPHALRVLLSIEG
jgi:hypothetical protein